MYCRRMETKGQIWYGRTDRAYAHLKTNKQTFQGKKPKQKTFKSHIQEHIWKSGKWYHGFLQ